MSRSHIEVESTVLVHVLPSYGPISNTAQTITDLVSLCPQMGYATWVIKSFRHKGLAEYFNTGSHRKVQAKHAGRLKLILGLLHGATHAGVLNAPGLGFHPLKGKPKRWAVSVDENYRVIFRFEGGHALEVDYDDYH